MIHAYCIRRAGEPPPADGIAGLGGAPVRVVEAGRLGMWLSEVAAANPTADLLRDHDRVVRHALRTATPLPIRFGAGAFATEAAALAALVGRAADLETALERVAGHVEMGVRVDWDPPGAPDAAPAEPSAADVRAADARRDPPPAQGGRAYLEARRDALRERDALVDAATSVLDRVERALALDGVPSARTVLPAPGTAGIVAHLVRRTEVERYGRAVAAAREALPEHRIIPSGPWAPYSFS